MNRFDITGARTDYRTNGVGGKIAFDGTYLWVTNTERVAVTRLAP